MEGNSLQQTEATVELSLEKLFLLENDDVRTGDKILIGERCAPWPSDHSSRTESWLQKAAEEGYSYAMERLADISSNQFNGVSDEGWTWLRRAAECGNPFAMVKLSGRLLEDRVGDSAVVAEYWLRKAIESGYAFAMIALSLYLLETGGEEKEAESYRLLRLAADNGDRTAMMCLGSMYLTTKTAFNRQTEAAYWLGRGAGLCPNEISAISASLYEHALAFGVPYVRKRLMAEIAVPLRLSLSEGEPEGMINFAYLLRRREIPCSSNDGPSLDSLLQFAVAQRHPMGIINEVLRLAAGIQCSIDWQAGDGMLATLENPEPVRHWWSILAQFGDPEGHLILGWLVRHGAISDPDGLGIAERMELARRGGWAVPEWLNFPVVGKPESE